MSCKGMGSITFGAILSREKVKTGSYPLTEMWRFFLALGVEAGGKRCYPGKLGGGSICIGCDVGFPNTLLGPR